MRDFMITLLTCSAAMSVIILLYLAVSPLLAKRYSPKGLYRAWMVIALGLMIPFRPHIDMPVAGPPAALESIRAISMQDIRTWAGTAGAPIYAPAAAPVPPQMEWWRIVLMVWLAGVVIYLVYQGVKHYRFVKMAGRWSESVTDEETLSLLEKLKTDMKISRHIPLLRCPCIGSPMLMGLIRSRILLPAFAFTEDELGSILRHELVHYRRKDLWGRCLMLMATAMHWFNPFVHLMARAVYMQCELVCDAEVVEYTPIDTRQRYSEIILTVVRRKSGCRTALSTNFYGGKNGMKKRISSIMDTRKKRIGLTVICAVLIMTVGAGIVYAARSADTMGPDVEIKLCDYRLLPEDFGTMACNVESRPELEFYITGEDIAKIEVMCETEYLYAVDWTETQHEKYWNTGYYQTYDEETKTCTYYPERRYDKSMILTFDEGFSDYGEIWYRWTAWNMTQWASEDSYSHFLLSDKKVTGDMTEDEKLSLAAGDDGSGRTGIGHIQLAGYPQELTEDRITVIVTDREGHSTKKVIPVKVSNNERNETVITAYVAE